MSKLIKYVAAPTHVREVTLRGTADYAFWQNHLASYDLKPADRDSRATILVIAASMSYMSIRFTEVSFSVEVVPPDQYEQPDAGFLMHAFNTSRIFAFSERVFFGTPYNHADCRLSANSLVSMEVAEGEHKVFQATMNADALADAASRVPLRNGAETWEGPIFLPRKPGATSNKHYVFFGKMYGEANVYPFRSNLDKVLIAPTPIAPIFQDLIDSDFVGEEWSVKTDATHARSKTYPRK